MNIKFMIKNFIRGFLKLIRGFLLWNLRVTVVLWRYGNRDSNPRRWSNDTLKRFAPLFTGHVLNVSGGNDKDKEGQQYRDYFTGATSYQITNYITTFQADSFNNEIQFDLNQPLSPSSDLINKFDVVFTHTVLEHVYHIHIAIENLCRLTKDIVITVIPYVQSFHHIETQYHDYWRISPYALINLFNEHNLKTLYIDWNQDPIGNIYLFHIASKQPQKWENLIQMPDSVLFGPGYDRELLLCNKQIQPGTQITTLNNYINSKDKSS